MEQKWHVNPTWMHCDLLHENKATWRIYVPQLQREMCLKKKYYTHTRDADLQEVLTPNVLIALGHTGPILMDERTNMDEELPVRLSLFARFMQWLRGK